VTLRCHRHQPALCKPLRSYLHSKPVEFNLSASSNAGTCHLFIAGHQAIRLLQEKRNTEVVRCKPRG
jgi:hypothetical protein